MDSSHNSNHFGCCFAASGSYVVIIFSVEDDERRLGMTSRDIDMCVRPFKSVLTQGMIGGILVV